MTEQSPELEVVEQERVQIAFELIGLVPVNGEHPDDFEMTEADWERLKTCSCAHCLPTEGICPMTVQAMIGRYLSERDDDLAHALAPKLATDDDVARRLSPPEGGDRG